jgi:hypothetical protein
MHRNTTLENLTNYQFNINATDEEIMLIAKQSETLGFIARKETVDYITNYSLLHEYRKSKTMNLVYNLN